MSDIYTSGRYWEKHSYDSAFKAALAIETLRRANISWPTDAHLADIGCGNGTFLKALCDYLEINQITYWAEGYDIAPNAIAEASRKYSNSHLKFHLGGPSSINTTYDFILVNDVVEHLENPYAFMRGLRGKAKWYLVHLPIEVSISHILIKRPIGSYKRMGHLHFFSADSAHVLFQEAGFNVNYIFWSASSRILVRFPASLLLKIGRWLRWGAYQIGPQVASKVFGGPIMYVLRDSR